MTEKRQLEITTKFNDLASKGFKKLSNQLQSLGKTARGALNSLPNLVAAIAAGAAVRKGVQVFNDLANGLDEVNTAAASINTTADSLYLLRNAAGENGVEFADLTAAMRTFEIAVGDARLGSVAQREALQRLGLDTSTLSGKNKDAVETFAQVADALDTVEDSSIRTKLAVQLFGEGGAKLLPLLQQGGQSLREYAAAQRDAGKALTSEQIQRASEYRRSLQDLTNTMQTFAEQIVLEVAPAVTELFTDLRTSIDQNGPAIRAGMIDLLLVVSQGVELIVDAGFIVKKSIAGWDLLGKALAKVYLDMFGTTDEIRAANRRLDESNEAVKANDRAWGELGDQFDTLRGKIRALREEQGKQIQESKQAANTGFQVNVTATTPSDTDLFFEGFSENVEKAKVKWGDFYQAGLDASQQIADRGLSRLTDAFADIITGAKSSKEAFKDLASAMLTDLARIISQLLIMKAIKAGSSALGGLFLEDGGVVQGTMSTPIKTQAFAHGGIASSPTLAMFGEGRGAEAFVPLPDGRSIPVTMQGGGGGTVINFNISAVDGASVKRMLIEQKGTITSMVESAVSGGNVPFRQAMQKAAN